MTWIVIPGAAPGGKTISISTIFFFSTKKVYIWLLLVRKETHGPRAGSGKMTFFRQYAERLRTGR